MKAQLFRVLDLVHEALVNDIPMTKRYYCFLNSIHNLSITMSCRDIYYKDVSLFQKQSVVDNVSQRYKLCYTWTFNRDACSSSTTWLPPFNLTDRISTSYVIILQSMQQKLTGGFVAARSFKGPRLRSGPRYAPRLWRSRTCKWFWGQRNQFICFYNKCLPTRQGTLIPVGEDIARFEVDDDITWVLVVEKEVSSCTRYHRMFDDHFHSRLYSRLCASSELPTTLTYPELEWWSRYWPILMANLTFHDCNHLG